MKELYYFPVTFTNPFDGSPLYQKKVYCYVFEDENEVCEYYSIYDLSNTCNLTYDAFREFSKKGPLGLEYITAMTFVKMCFYYGPKLLSYTIPEKQCVSLPALQNMAYDLLGAAANAHWAAQAMINKKLTNQSN